jgi:hypothetical protein
MIWIKIDGYDISKQNSIGNVCCKVTVSVKGAQTQYITFLVPGVTGNTDLIVVRYSEAINDPPNAVVCLMSTVL